jgi:hypothetical protein
MWWSPDSYVASWALATRIPFKDSEMDAPTHLSSMCIDESR